MSSGSSQKNENVQSPITRTLPPVSLIFMIWRRYWSFWCRGGLRWESFFGILGLRRRLSIFYACKLRSSRKRSAALTLFALIVIRKVQFPVRTFVGGIDDLSCKKNETQAFGLPPWTSFPRTEVPDSFECTLCWLLWILFRNLIAECLPTWINCPAQFGDMRGLMTK